MRGVINMKILNVILFLSLISTLPLEATRKKVRYSKRSEVTKYQTEDLERRQQQMKTEEATCCTPNMIKASTKLGTTALQGLITIVVAIIKSAIDK